MLATPTSVGGWRAQCSIRDLISSGYVHFPALCHKYRLLWPQASNPYGLLLPLLTPSRLPSSSAPSFRQYTVPSLGGVSGVLWQEIGQESKEVSGVRESSDQGACLAHLSTLSFHLEPVAEAGAAQAVPGSRWAELLTRFGFPQCFSPSCAALSIPLDACGVPRALHEDRSPQTESGKPS